MKKLTALLLAMLLVFSFAACGNNNEPTEPATEAPTDAATEPSAEDPTQPASLIQSLYLSLNESADSMKNLSITLNDDGSFYVEMYGDVVKKGNFTAAEMQPVSEAFAASGLKELNGQMVTGENQEISCGLVADCGEEGFVTADYIGEVPPAFASGYAAIESCISQLLADTSEYTGTTPDVRGIPAEGDKASLDAIIGAMNLDSPGSFIIKNISVNNEEMFNYDTGLLSADGIIGAISFTSQIMTTAYSLVIVTLEEGVDTATVAKDFEDNINWLKWMCVQPDSAAVAVKDNQVLCLLGSGEIFTQTVTAMDAAGWLPVSTLENPNLEG